MSTSDRPLRRGAVRSQRRSGPLLNVLTMVLALLGPPAAALAQDPKETAAPIEAAPEPQGALQTSPAPAQRGDAPSFVLSASHSRPAEHDVGSEIRPGRQTAVSSPEALADLLPLVRPCMAESPCAIQLNAPSSPHSEMLPLADELSALVAAELSRREALCVADTDGHWAKLSGEKIPPCAHETPEPHRAAIRLEPKGNGFTASLSFEEGGLEHAEDDSSRAFAHHPSRLRLTTEFSESQEIPFVASRFAEGLGDAMGTEAPSLFDVFLKPPEPPSFHVNLKLGNTLTTLKGFDFSAFSLRFDLEFDYYIRPYLMAFLEIGLTIGNSAAKSSSKSSGSTDTSDGSGEAGDAPSDSGDSDAEDSASDADADSGQKKGSFSLVPVKLGLKFNPLYQYQFRPYVGLGLGLGILSDLVEADSREVTLSISGVLGIAWVPLSHLGFNLETSLNFDELRVESGSSLLFSFTIDFGIMVLF